MPGTDTGGRRAGTRRPRLVGGVQGQTLTEYLVASGSLILAAFTMSVLLSDALRRFVRTVLLAVRTIGP